MGIWRYGAMLPVVAASRARVTLGEGWTPLIRDEWAGQPVHWKIDALMPTGSYKDRGVCVMVNWLKGLGYEVLVDDSSGNAGASLACYAARAGLRSFIFVPEVAPEPKKAQVAVYGGELVEVPGPRSEATKAAEAMTYNSRRDGLCLPCLAPCLLAGPDDGRLGDLGTAWAAVPDWIVAPVGHGGTLLGAWRGFQHLRRSGVTTKLPRLIAVQAEPYTPVYDAFQNHWTEIRPDRTWGPSPPTALPSATRCAGLPCSMQCNFPRAPFWPSAKKRCGKLTTALAARGLFVEPTSATIAAALQQLPRRFNQTTRLVVSAF